MEPLGGSGDPGCFWDGHVLDKIADLVEYRFKEGRLFLVVGRMVVSEDERVNMLQDHVRRCLCRWPKDTGVSGIRVTTVVAYFERSFCT